MFTHTEEWWHRPIITRDDVMQNEMALPTQNGIQSTSKTW